MSLLLNIDTSNETAFVSIAEDGKVLQQAVNKEQKDHATFLHIAIQTICKNAGISLHQLDAVAISAGPGSYTGLRVGMASAKGLSFALNIPLITLGTLKILAWQSIKNIENSQIDLPVLFCPMIDARRMEVFTAMYDNGLNVLISPHSLVIDENSFADRLLNNKIIFSGDGAAKWKVLCHNQNAIFFEEEKNALYMSELSFKKYQLGEFADVAYSEPLYVKEFFNGIG